MVYSPLLAKYHTIEMTTTIMYELEHLYVHVLV